MTPVGSALKVDSSVEVMPSFSSLEKLPEVSSTCKFELDRINIVQENVALQGDPLPRKRSNCAVFPLSIPIARPL
jgi:hypothetical protein